MSDEMTTATQSSMPPMDIVCIAVSNWGVVKSNPDYTVLELAKRGHRILVVEPFESIVSALRMASIQKRNVERNWGLRKEADNIWIYRPPPIAVPGQSRTPVAGRLSGRMLAQLIKKTANSLNMTPDIIWSFMYNSATTLNAFPNALKIYENGDEDIALARNARQRHTVQSLDDEVCRASDLIFAVTEELCAPRRVHNENTFEVNCGVDLEIFGRKPAVDAQLPSSIAAIPKPIIGYFGGLDPWKIDIPLITEIARLKPDWSIVFVGYVWFRFDPSVFDNLSNIHVLGPQDYDDIPLFLSAMDVGLMPFPLNLITKNGDALKCYEYLAAGLPVVGRDVPVARRLPEFVKTADTAQEFVAACQAQMDDTSQTSQSRRAAMENHTWSRRVDQKLDIIKRFKP